MYIVIKSWYMVFGIYCNIFWTPCICSIFCICQVNAKIYHEFSEVSTCFQQSNFYFRCLIHKRSRLREEIYMDLPPLELQVTHKEPFSDVFIISLRSKSFKKCFLRHHVFIYVHVFNLTNLYIYKVTHIRCPICSYDLLYQMNRKGLWLTLNVCVYFVMRVCVIKSLLAEARWKLDTRKVFNNPTLGHTRDM